MDDIIKRQNLQALGFKMTGLRKARSKLIAQALIHGEAENGNHKVIAFNTGGGYGLVFTYRGTPITIYTTYDNEFRDVPTRFSDYPSTINQRKIARESVLEFFGALQHPGEYI